MTVLTARHENIFCAVSIVLAEIATTVIKVVRHDKPIVS